MHQRMNDQPLLQYYSHEFKVNHTFSKSIVQLEGVEEPKEETNPALKKNATLKYDLFALSKDEILVRFANLADRFDKENITSVPEIDVMQFAQDLYLESNGW